MIEARFAASANPTRYQGRFYAYRVVVGAIGGGVQANDGIFRPMFGLDVLYCPRKTELGEFDPWYAITVTPGVNAPVWVRIAEDESDLQRLQSSNILPVFQEGDVVGAALPGIVGVNPGPQGMVQMARDSLSANKLVIPTVPATNAFIGGVPVVLGQGTSQVNSDSTAAAGAALDTGLVSYGGTTIGLYIEVTFAAALTGTRTLDVILGRADATTFSLIDPVRQGASPLSLAVGRKNWLGAIGEFMGNAGAAGAAAAAMDAVWSMPLPAGGVTNQIRVNLGAGGAEVPRIRIFQRANTTC